MHLFYSVLVWGHEGREVHTLLFLSKIKDKVSYRKNDSASKQGDNNYFLSCYLSVSNDQKPCFVSFPKCWYKSMNKDTKNHIIDASLGITSTHTETGKIAHREKEVQKATKNGMRKKKKSEKCKETNMGKCILFTERDYFEILTDKNANHILYIKQNYCWHQKYNLLPAKQKTAGKESLNLCRIENIFK